MSKLKVGDKVRLKYASNFWQYKVRTITKILNELDEPYFLNHSFIGWAEEELVLCKDCDQCEERFRCWTN